MDVVGTSTNASSPIDEPTNPITRSAISYFTITADHFPWRTPTPDIIESRRVALSDRLIFDILLASGGVPNPDTLYPPTDAETLQRLLDTIASSTYDTLKKDCLVFFLLKWHRDGREERFARERGIPPQFGMLAEAYWLLDVGVDLSVCIRFVLFYLTL